MLGKTFLGAGGVVGLLIASGAALAGGCGGDDEDCTFAGPECTTGTGPTPCTTPADCDDKNECTTDTCAMSVCAHEALPDFMTECSGARGDTCYGGVCVPFDSTLAVTSTHSFVRGMDMQKTEVSSGLAVGAEGTPTDFNPVVSLVNEGDLTTADLDNCFSDNVFSTSAPANLEELAPCDATGNGGDFTAGALNLLVLIAEMAEAPPKDTYKNTPVPAEQPTMPDATIAPPTRFEAPTKPDLDAITVPTKPAG